MASRRSLALLQPGLPSSTSMLLVRSYRTAPACAGKPAIGGVFLWLSSGHPHWALPSKPGHQGARTFLNRIGDPDRNLACFIASIAPRVIQLSGL